MIEITPGSSGPRCFFNTCGLKLAKAKRVSSAPRNSDWQNCSISCEATFEAFESSALEVGCIVATMRTINITRRCNSMALPLVAIVSIDSHCRQYRYHFTSLPNHEVHAGLNPRLLAADHNLFP